MLEEVNEDDEELHSGCIPLGMRSVAHLAETCSLEIAMHDLDYFIEFRQEAAGGNSRS